ncbi:MAG: DinB family protein [Williamsia sp.]|nr:DinB family protein [Williamsia sp.]
MVIETLKSLFIRDLNKLYDEIQLYNEEKSIWKTDKRISNSAGNLCLHLMGNLNTYIGREIGNTGYIRNREAEFSKNNIPREQLLDQLRETIKTVITSLDDLNDAMLENEYPLCVFDKKTSTGYLLIHLATHLTYHLGQINYHRRLIDI